MARLRGSTCAFGFEAICLGSVTAWGVGRVWAMAVSATTVLMNMTIAKSRTIRMSGRTSVRCNEESIEEKSVAEGHAFAFLCISTVLQVLSAAWQRFSSAVD